MKPLFLSFSFRVLLACPAFLAAQPGPAAEKTPATDKIVLVGDSTVASKSGWGDAFAKLCGPGIECVNLALGGRSSKSYRDEGHWQKVLDAKPTWVLIQFGHNDQPGKGPKRETDPKTTFRENLARYVAEARAIGAKPVLVTSLTRRNFDAQGKIAPDSLSNYAEGTKAVAAEQNVPLLDLNARSIEQMNQLGPQAAVVFDAKPKDPARSDKTHLSEKGAAEAAKLVADEIRKNVPELAKLLKSGKVSSAAGAAEGRFLFVKRRQAARSS